MGVPDCQVEEPDERLCEEHQLPRPCYVCQLEAVEARWERMREDGE
jgi:hypothetical protein